MLNCPSLTTYSQAENSKILDVVAKIVFVNMNIKLSFVKEFCFARFLLDMKTESYFILSIFYFYLILKNVTANDPKLKVIETSLKLNKSDHVDNPTVKLVKIVGKRKTVWNQN